MASGTSNIDLATRQFQLDDDGVGMQAVGPPNPNGGDEQELLRSIENVEKLLQQVREKAQGTAAIQTQTREKLAQVKVLAREEVEEREPFNKRVQAASHFLTATQAEVVDAKRSLWAGASGLTFGLLRLSTASSSTPTRSTVPEQESVRPTIAPVTNPPKIEMHQARAGGIFDWFFGDNNNDTPVTQSDIDQLQADYDAKEKAYEDAAKVYQDKYIDKLPEHATHVGTVITTTATTGFPDPISVGCIGSDLYELLPSKLDVERLGSERNEALRDLAQAQSDFTWQGGDSNVSTSDSN